MSNFALNPDQMQRPDWMGLLARARPEDLAGAMAGLDLPGYRLARPPETGAVMLRGRQGATGAAFNLGEMTVTRCALVLDDGVMGLGYVQGRSARQARQAALCDALLQGAEAARIRRAVLAPLAKAEAARRQDRAEKAAATRVEFFTLQRGEDA